MKKVLFVITFIAISIVSYAQDTSNYSVKDNSIVISKVIQTGKTINETYAVILPYMAKFYTNSNATNRVDLKDHLIYKGIFSSLACEFGRCINGEHTIDIQIREGRTKVTISSTTAQAAYNKDVYYNWVDYPPFQKYSMKSYFLKKTVLSAFDMLVKEMNSTMQIIENTLTKPVSTEDEW